jgi:hypothetical protein
LVVAQVQEAQAAARQEMAGQAVVVVKDRQLLAQELQIKDLLVEHIQAVSQYKAAAVVLSLLVEILAQLYRQEMVEVL